MSFYYVMSSNAHFPLNTIGNFSNRINLLHPLEGNWEVGLVEISYTKSWKNLTRPVVLSIEQMFENPKPFISLTNIYSYAPFKDEDRKGVVRAGHYETISDLCNEIEKEMKAFSSEVDILPSFHHDEITKYVIIKPGFKDKKPMIPSMNKELSRLLGFDWYSTKVPPYTENQMVMGNRPADITRGIHSLYVYCSLLVPQYVADTRAKLLRTVEISKSKYGEDYTKEYTNIHYIPLVVGDFESIEIDIKDDSNEPIRFMYGRVQLKLHFRKCTTLT